MKCHIKMYKNVYKSFKFTMIYKSINDYVTFIYGIFSMMSNKFVLIFVII